MSDVPRTRSRLGVLAFVTVALSTLACLAVLEVGIRLARGSLAASPEKRYRGVPLELLDSIYPATYDAGLGWIPTPGSRGRKNPWQRRVSIDDRGLRVNGAGAISGGPAVLAVGDSYTFGDEVDDEDTWPAELQRLLARPVRNGGVFGYGFDQIVLRAERLLESEPIDHVVASIAPGDVERCEFAYRYGWKPYFELVEGRLELRNTPVPRPGTPASDSAAGRLLRFSHLADFVAQRLDPEALAVPDSIRAHDRGPELGRLLVERLARSATEHGARLLLVTQWTPGRRGDPLAPTLERARELGVPVLELKAELLPVLKRSATGVPRFFHLRHADGGPAYGHMTPAGNRAAAAAIAARIQPAG